MGVYFNPGNDGFTEALRSEIYVDKSGLITYTNKVLGTKQKYVCVSRPRRFGKTMAAEMLTAYYSRGCVSYDMFAVLAIGKDPSFKNNLNKYNVIFLNMQRFLSESDSIEKMVSKVSEKVVNDMLKTYPDLHTFASSGSFTDTLQDLYDEKRIGLVFVIDEWDCVFREYQADKTAQKIYLDFLRNLLKDRVYVALAYMTGILPIKKYGSHSALNMFSEFSMTNPHMLAEYIGFTENEVRTLCREYQMDYDEMAEWYNGYSFLRARIVYNPKSVVEALTGRCYDNYWSQTETYEALSVYIKMNFDGLRDEIVQLLAGERRHIDIRSFTNDMVTFESYNDVLTLLIHLGYLGYDMIAREVYIPNKEISDEFFTSIKNSGWDRISSALRASEDLLKATWRSDAQTVADRIEEIHGETSILKYNDENALSCVITLAYYSARQYYNIIREMPAGKGFADLVFLPRKNHSDKPAMLIELKWDKTAEGAMRQIEKKQYSEALAGYEDNALLIAINYDKESKRHECVIRRANTQLEV